MGKKLFCVANNDSWTLCAAILLYQTKFGPFMGCVHNTSILWESEHNSSTEQCYVFSSYKKYSNKVFIMCSTQ